MSNGTTITERMDATRRQRLEENIGMLQTSRSGRLTVRETGASDIGHRHATERRKICTLSYVRHSTRRP